MEYYEIRVASQRYHKDEALTYSAQEPVEIGAVVIAPLRNENVVGVVVRRVRKPRFATKPILRVVPNAVLPRALIQLSQWLSLYYPAPSGMIMQLVLPGSLVNKPRSTDSIQVDGAQATAAAPDLPPLTAEQLAVVQDFTTSNETSFLLHGDTGTGKTRVYIELAKRALDTGKSAIILTPEISLTPQLAGAMSGAFPGRTVVMHSHLTPAERRDSWLRIAEASRPLVVIGARSALFAPLQSLGLIVIDEVHDQAYKQEQAPYYQATRVAAKLASLHGAKLLLGSATPSVSDYYAFEHKKLPILRMQTPAIANTYASSVKVIDLRNKQSFGRSRWISDGLIVAINEALGAKKQSMVFLNRRGTARLVLCQDCGWQALCPHCDLPLTYHGDQHRVTCHTCGYNAAPPSSCTECESAALLFRGIGTKSLADELERLFPQARIARFDSDNNKAERLDQQYSAVRDGSVDILVGTQLLSKGLDLPSLQVVGVALADTGLYFPDFTAEERTYQMIQQVMGRVGRGHGLSKIFIQTYQPDSSVIAAAVAKDYATFYAAQITERQRYMFPPFCYVLKLSCMRASESGAERAATALAKQLAAKQLPVSVTGPAPAFTEKVRGQYRWQIIIKSTQRQALVDIVASLPANWTHDIDPSNLL